MEKSQKKCLKKSIKKSGKSYSEDVKRKIVGEIKAGFHSQRPHASLDFQTPEKVHSDNVEIKKRWKHYQRKSTSIGKQTEKIF